MTHRNEIVFIHGLFMNPKSWTPWVHHFEAKNFRCHAPAYPFHEGEPSSLREHIDPGLGKLTFQQVLDGLSTFIATLPAKPILIGHSMGGLAVQKLIDLGVAGVCIDPAPPTGITSFKWSFLKANLSTVNPFKGDGPCLPSIEWFHYAFCNTMTMEATKLEYERFVVPESRNIPRTGSKNDGKIDLAKPHAPLLIIAGEKDNIVPSSLNRKNFEAYTHKDSVTDFKEFPDRTHYICGQAGWEQVADFIAAWLHDKIQAT
jgi:pimeloyl-ACP methyl ester carboxylesterase